MRKVTLVGERWARVGIEFLNAERCEAAGACPVARACQNLEWDREYRVASVRSIHHDVCVVHEEGVRVAEVEELPFVASLEAVKTRGTAVRWNPPVCHIRGCPNWDRCFPHGPKPGSEYALEKIEGPLECPMGHSLVGVTLRSVK